jgi:hypothetical protein
MNAQTKPRRATIPLAWLFACALLLLFSCESSTTEPTGGETHFLTWCDSASAPCGGGLSCVCGVCSLPCTSSTECQGLPTSECLASTDPSGCSDAQPVSRCDVPCNWDTDCSALSGSHTCELGACRSGDPVVGSCAQGEVDANQVLVIGDSFFATSHQITAYLEGLAREAGVLPDGQRYRDNSHLIGNALALGGNGIAGQYEQGKAEASVHVVVMNGGGADVLASRCQAPLAECSALLDAAAAAEQLFAQMAADGVSDVVYAFYPDPVDATIRDKMDVLRPLIQTACANSPVPCHWLDLRPAFAGHYDEYILADGMNPADAGSRASAEAIWLTMQRACVAQ